MTGETETRYDRRYYRLGLWAAARRDLSGAVRYARYALAVNPAHGGAAKLLGLCRGALGEGEPGEAAGGNTAGDGLTEVRALAAQKKWRAAEKAARALPCQSVRVLNLRGCLHAAGKRYAQAAACFAEALTLDHGNALAAAGFAATVARRK
jgi:tetratricopeptide (TPR) repeat protein